MKTGSRSVTRTSQQTSTSCCTVVLGRKSRTRRGSAVSVCSTYTATSTSSLSRDGADYDCLLPRDSTRVMHDALSVRPSVCLSRSCILPRRVNIFLKRYSPCGSLVKPFQFFTRNSDVVPLNGDRMQVRLAVWLSGNALALINVVALRQTRLVPGWVTVCGRLNHFVM